MSQLQVPINGGSVPQVQTTVISEQRANVLSPQFVEAKKLESRPTEWVPDGRPIYHRLPGASETYRIDFYNLVNEAGIGSGSTTVIEETGFVFIPYGQSENGPVSLEVTASEDAQSLLIRGGTILWKYGKNEVIPVLASMAIVDVLNGKYDVSYELTYDDSPLPFLYSVSDFSLSGISLNITSGSDNILGWRYTPENAFINNDNSFWSSEDNFFPSYAQPTESFIQWESDLTHAYSQITLKLPLGVGFSGTATLYYEDLTTPVAEGSLRSDGTNNYLDFKVAEPNLQNSWRIVFSSNSISVEQIFVSGNLTLLQPQATASPRARLVMYPEGTSPKTVINDQGKTLPVTYCKLAEVTVNSDYQVTKITDLRTIIRREYAPVADWLTRPVDSDLIDLYEQVSDYQNTWLSPISAMKQEYSSLEVNQIVVES